MCIIEPRFSNVTAVIMHRRPRSELFVGLLFVAVLLFPGASFAAGIDAWGRIDHRHHFPERIEYRFDHPMSPPDADSDTRMMYFGPTRLGDSWEFGLVIDQGDEGLGKTFRGLAIIRRF